MSNNKIQQQFIFNNVKKYENTNDSEKNIIQNVNNQLELNQQNNNDQTIHHIQKQKTSLRCFHKDCNKKLTISTARECICKNNFCGEHIYTFLHNCNVDIKSIEKEKIKKNNPVVCAKKIDKL